MWRRGSIGRDKRIKLCLRSIIATLLVAGQEGFVCVAYDSVRCDVKGIAAYADEALVGSDAFRSERNLEFNDNLDIVGKSGHLQDGVHFAQRILPGTVFRGSGGVVKPCDEFVRNLVRQRSRDYIAVEFFLCAAVYNQNPAPPRVTIS